MKNHWVIQLNSTARITAYIVLHLYFIILIYHLLLSLNKRVLGTPSNTGSLTYIFLFSIKRITNIDSVAIQVKHNLSHFFTLYHNLDNIVIVSQEKNTFFLLQPVQGELFWRCGLKKNWVILTWTWPVSLSANLKAVKREKAQDNQKYYIYQCQCFFENLFWCTADRYNSSENLALTVKGLQMS